MLHPAQRIALTAAHPKEIVVVQQAFKVGLAVVVLGVPEVMRPVNRVLLEGRIQAIQ
jgi:hypothetical protein